MYNPNNTLTRRHDTGTLFTFRRSVWTRLTHVILT
jgi:hypothetical protein